MAEDIDALDRMLEESMAKSEGKADSTVVSPSAEVKVEEKKEEKKEKKDDKDRSSSRKRSRSRSRDREKRSHRSSSKDRHSSHSDRSKERTRDRDSDRDKRRDDRDRDHDRRRDDRDRDRDRDRHRDDRDYRDRDRRYREDHHIDRNAERERERERDREKDRDRVRDLRPLRPLQEDEVGDRDLRSVFVTNLPIKADERDIREFFEKTGGKVRDVRLVRDRGSVLITNGHGPEIRLGGLDRIEEMDSIQGVSNAIALSGTQMMTSTINVQASQAEKNRERAAQRAKAKEAPMRLYIGNVHPNATIPDLERIFKEFGSIDSVELDRDEHTLTSKGYAFIQYRDPEGAKRALVGGNGYIFAGQPLKVGLVSDTTKTAKAGALDSVNEDTDQGVSMNAAKRASLMAKLIRDDPNDENAVSLSASTCVLLKNMFDQMEASLEPNFEAEMTMDVKEEAMKFGELSHIFVDVKSDGFIYLRYSSIASAAKALAALNGRWFGGRQVSAAFFPEATYGAMFPNWRG